MRTTVIGLLCDSNQLGAHFVVMPPDHPVCAIFEWTVAREEESKFIGDVESVGVDTHASVGNVGNEAVERRCADPELDLRQTPCRGVSRLSSDRLELMIRSSQVWVASELTPALPVKTYRTGITRSLSRVVKFSLLLSETDAVLMRSPARRSYSPSRAIPFRGMSFDIGGFDLLTRPTPAHP